MPHQSGPDDANAAVFADAGTSRAVIDVTKHQGLAFYPYIEPLTYVWYRRLWDAFALSDEQLAGVLGGRVHRRRVTGWHRGTN
jgi:hypothetical protein